jgi:hypothetical protein
MTRMHTAAAAQIMGETTRPLKIVGGTARDTGITTCRETTNKRRVQQEVEPPAERRREATGQHNNQPNKRDPMQRQEVDVPAEGFGEVERAADKRSGRQERQQRFFVVGCVVVCDIFYSFLVYMLGNCYVLVGGVKKELVFAGTLLGCPWSSSRASRSNLTLISHLPFTKNHVDSIAIIMPLLLASGSILSRERFLQHSPLSPLLLFSL